MQGRLRATLAATSIRIGTNLEGRNRGAGDRHTQRGFVQVRAIACNPNTRVTGNIEGNVCCLGGGLAAERVVAQLSKELATWNIR